MAGLFTREGWEAEEVREVVEEAVCRGVPGTDGGSKKPV